MSTYLCEHARPGMVVGLDSVGGDFVLPARAPAAHPVRLRRQRHHPGDVDAAHPARRGLRPARSPSSTTRASAEEACYRDELDAMPGVRVLHGYTRATAGSRPRRAASAPSTWPPRCPTRTRCSSAARPRSSTPCASTARTPTSESFVPPVFDRPGRILRRPCHFADSGVERRSTTAGRCSSRPRPPA